MRSFVLTLFATPLLTGLVSGQAPSATDVAKAAIIAVGGEQKLPKLFRIKEQLVMGEDPKGKMTTRLSVLEPPSHWWMGKKDRVVAEKEPAIFLVWTWTLGSLADPKSVLKPMPDLEINGKPAQGLEVSGTITPPLKAYFDKESKRLVRIDWRNDTHSFSNWKEADGYKYPARCVGQKVKGKVWYHSEIVEFERLKGLPADLKR